MNDGRNIRITTGPRLTGMPANPPWLAISRPMPSADFRLFCFPYAGGNSLIYRAWPGNLPSNIEVCPVQLPGRGSRIRETPHKTLSSMVESLGETLPRYLDKPFVFFGHSMGAMIAFELARLLRRSYGIEPVRLFVSGRCAPHIPDPDPPTYNLPKPEFIEELRRLNGTPRDALENPELMELMIPLLRADFEVVQTYAFSPAEPLSCPISAFGGLEDEEVMYEHLKGWERHTTGHFTLKMFPGDHFFLNTSSEALLLAISADLSRSSGPCPIPKPLF